MIDIAIMAAIIIQSFMAFDGEKCLIKYYFSSKCAKPLQLPCIERSARFAVAEIFTLGTTLGVALYTTTVGMG